MVEAWYHPRDPSSGRLDRAGRSILVWVISHTELFSPVLFIGLALIVELGLRFREASSDIDGERQSLLESARDRLSVLLSFLLGFSLPMALSHYEQRSQLVIDEANAISTTYQRAQMLSEPLRGTLIRSLVQYVDLRIEFSKESDERALLASVDRAKELQNEMWQEVVLLAQQKPDAVTSLLAQSLGGLSDLIEQRLAAYEKRIPIEIWLVLLMISALTCFAVGYSMRRRHLLAMLVLPLTVAIVLSLVSELDSPRTGLVRVGQQSLQRIQSDLRADAGPHRWQDKGVTPEP